MKCWSCATDTCAAASRKAWLRASTVSAVLNTENDLEIQVVGAREQ